MLSVVGKVYGRVLINRIRDKTENVIAEVQGGFRRGRGCTDQIFTVRQICEKYLGKGKDVYFAFLDLEKAYDKVDRDAMWNVLRLYGIGGRLLRGVKSFHVGSKAYVRVGNEVSEWFPVGVGLRQGCVMSPWLFNLYMDGVVREVNARVLGRGLERMDNERLLKKVMNAKVDGRNARGRPRFGWMDGVKRALNDRRMDIREASERARNRNEWRMIVTQF